MTCFPREAAAAGRVQSGPPLFLSPQHFCYAGSLARQERGLSYLGTWGQAMLENLLRIQQSHSGKLGSIAEAFQEVGIQASADLVIEMIRQRHQQEVDARLVETVRSYLQQ